MANGTAAKGKPQASKPPAQCEFCHMTFKKLEHLQRHLRTHTQDRPYACAHEGCGKAFARQDTLNRHARLHIRDAESEAAGRPRAPRRRNKSTSDSSTAAGRRASVSPYPNSARRSSDPGNAATAKAVVTGFSPPSSESHDLPCSAPPPAKSSGSSRFSTLDLLGLSPTEQSLSASPAESISALPTLSELYATENFDSFNAFESFSPVSRSLAPTALSTRRASQPEVEPFSYVAAASPWSDDGHSVASSTSGKTPSLAHSGFSSLSSSYDPVQSETNHFGLNSPQLAPHSLSSYSYQQPNQAASCSFNTKPQGLQGFDNIRSIERLFQAAGLEAHLTELTGHSPNLSDSFGMLSPHSSYSAHAPLVPLPLAASPPNLSYQYSSSLPDPAPAFKPTSTYRDGQQFLSASVISQFASPVDDLSKSAFANSLGLEGMNSSLAEPTISPAASLYPMVPLTQNHGDSSNLTELSWLSDSYVYGSDWLRDS